MACCTGHPDPGQSWDKNGVCVNAVVRAMHGGGYDAAAPLLYNLRYKI
jgi:hypothetical protein